TAKAGQVLGARLVSPVPWTATTGSQTASLMNLADPDSSTSWVRVRSETATADTQFLAALVPMAATAWAGRAVLKALDSAERGASVAVAGGGVGDVRGYAALAASGTRNGAAVTANFASGVVTWPYTPPPAPVDAGVADAGVADAGVADAGVADAGVADAGVAD